MATIEEMLQRIPSAEVLRELCTKNVLQAMYKNIMEAVTAGDSGTVVYLGGLDEQDKASVLSELDAKGYKVTPYKSPTDAVGCYKIRW